MKGRKKKKKNTFGNERRIFRSHPREKKKKLDLHLIEKGSKLFDQT